MRNFESLISIKGFIMANTFEKAFARELGKNTAKLASNALFGSHWATPYRRVDSSRRAYNEAKADAANARAEAARARANAAVAEANNRMRIARDQHLNQIDAAVIANVDKLTMVPIPATADGIVELMSTLSVQMRSIKFEHGEDDSEIRNKYLYALIEKYRQCIFELQCINPNDPHIPVYGQILVEKEYEIKQFISKEKIKKVSLWLFVAAFCIFLFLFVPMDGGNKDGSWNIPQVVVTLVLLASIFCILAIPSMFIFSHRKNKKQKEHDLNSYGVIAKQSRPTVEKTVKAVKKEEPIKKVEKKKAVVEEPSTEPASENSIFFDLNEKNRIGNALSHIWAKYSGIAPAELISRKPIFAADGVEDCILFVGVNPSYDPADDDYFLKNEDGKSLLYGSFYQREDAPDYFKDLEDFAAQAGKSYVQMNLLYARENDRNKLLKADSNFIREQLELTYDTIVKLQPKAILFFTTYCKNLIFGADRWVNPDVVKNGAYILNGTNIPVFFCEDVTTLTPANRSGMIELVKRAL